MQPTCKHASQMPAHGPRLCCSARFRRTVTSDPILIDALTPSRRAAAAAAAAAIARAAAAVAAAGAAHAEAAAAVAAVASQGAPPLEHRPNT